VRAARQRRNPKIIGVGIGRTVRAWTGHKRRTGNGRKHHRRNSSSSPAAFGFGKKKKWKSG
jgi:hypothetical protein